MLDFRFQEQAWSYVSQSGSAQNLEKLFASDDYFIDEDSNAYSLPTFVGNHDMGRFGYFLTNDSSGLADADKLARGQACQRYDVLRPWRAGHLLTATSRASRVMVGTRTLARTCSPARLRRTMTTI